MNLQDCGKVPHSCKSYKVVKSCSCKVVCSLAVCGISTPRVWCNHGGSDRVPGFLTRRYFPYCLPSDTQVFSLLLSAKLSSSWSRRGGHLLEGGKVVIKRGALDNLDRNL